MNARPAALVRDTLPGRWESALFEAKAWAFRLRRALADLGGGRPRRHPWAAALREAPVLAEFEGSLWPKDEANDALVVGKIHNLRLAAQRMHGLEIPAGATFGFWTQLGRATTARGYVVGRELREGCVIPAIGGGLCQLSNAIYDAAVRAGLEVVERHRHSRVLPGSLAEFDRDATVFWNYLDLRLRAPFAWRLEVELDAERLRLCIRGNAPTVPNPHPIALRARAAAAPGDCTSCGEEQCHRHVGPQAATRHRTWLLFEPWPEFLALLERERGEKDRVLGMPGKGRRAAFASLARFHAALKTRWSLWRNQPLPKARGDGLEVAARAIARRLRFDDVHLVVEQGLLPWLWRAGELAGRRYDVLMNALPMDAIQQRLDRAAALHPACATLRDFRAPAWLLEAERAALAGAERLIGPHAQVLAAAGARAHGLEWTATARARQAPSRVDGRPVVLFPASALARKGILELVAALEGLDVTVLAPPGAAESADVWRNAAVEHVATIAEGLARADLVVLPAWVEHQPRSLLAAIARGIPVVATAACGLPDSASWRRVPEGDAAALRDAIVASLAAAMPLSRPAPR